MYILLAQLYWPVWLIFDYYGMSKLGMLIGVLVVHAAFSIAWKIEFNDWHWWKEIFKS